MMISIPHALNGEGTISLPPPFRADCQLKITDEAELRWFVTESERRYNTARWELARTGRIKLRGSADEAFVIPAS